MSLSFVRWKHAEVGAVHGIFVLAVLEATVTKIGGDDPLGVLYVGATKTGKSTLADQLAAWIGGDTWAQGTLAPEGSYTFSHPCLRICTYADPEGVLRLNHDLLGTRPGTALWGKQPAIFYAEHQAPQVQEKTILDGHVARFNQLPPFNFNDSSLVHVYDTGNIPAAGSGSSYGPYVKRRDFRDQCLSAYARFEVELGAAVQATAGALT